MFDKKEDILVETKLGTLIASFNGSEENPGIVIELRRDGVEDELLVEVEQRTGPTNVGLLVDVWKMDSDEEPKHLWVKKELLLPF